MNSSPSSLGCSFTAVLEAKAPKQAALSKDELERTIDIALRPIYPNGADYLRSFGIKGRGLGIPGWGFPRQTQQSHRVLGMDGGLALGAFVQSANRKGLSCSQRINLALLEFPLWAML